MLHLIGYIIYSVMMMFMLWRTWTRHKSVVALLPTIILVYWLFAGGFFIIIDQLTNNSTSAIGVHYYDYFQKLLPVRLNNAYLLTITIYAAFILIIQLLVWRYWPASSKPKVSLHFNWKSMCSISLVLMMYALLLLWPSLKESFYQRQSFYLYLASHHSRFDSLAQVCKQLSVFISFITLTLFIVSDAATPALQMKKSYLAIAVVICVYVLVTSIALLIGSRHVLIFSGLFALCFYLLNTTKISYYKLALIAVLFVTPVWAIEHTRGLPIMNLLLSASTEIAAPVQTPTLIQSLLGTAFSNEMFVPHMSLYCIIQYDLPFTGGQSFVYLVHSLIPAAISGNRPPDSYTVYSRIFNYYGSQGFTISQPAGWYLNFGVAGALFGALIWGLFIGWTQRIFLLYKGSFKLMIILQATVTCSLVAYIPNMVRCGPEVYKALLFEAILLPAICLACCSKVGTVNE
ncbi:MAG: hypothetical protein IPO27_08600 [Bacteroidetes bacterium]|nr:hypothetical protein [Bacteroidota bacterium]